MMKATVKVRRVGDLKAATPSLAIGLPIALTRKLRVKAGHSFNLVLSPAGKIIATHVGKVVAPKKAVAKAKARAKSSSRRAAAAAK